MTLAQFRTGAKETEYHIGAWDVHLHSAQSVPHPVIRYRVPAYPMPARRIDVWHNPKDVEAAGLHEALRDGAKPYVPRGLRIFYDALKRMNISHLPLEAHCNRYFAQGQYVLAEFPYITDQFHAIIDREGEVVYLFGHEGCAVRFMQDICGIMAEQLPLHGSAVEHAGKVTCFLGNSGSGKSFALMAMLAVGYRFVADDELYIRDGFVRSVTDTISIRPGLVDSFAGMSIEQGEKAVVRTTSLGFDCADGGELSRIYLLLDSENRGYLQRFPCVARQSHCWLDLLTDGEIDASCIPEKVDRSKRFTEELLERAAIRRADFERMKQVCCDPARSLLSPEEILVNV